MSLYVARLSLLAASLLGGLVQQMAKLIKRSFILKKESEHLLVVAKRAVEIAIEKNEKVALEFINKENK